MEKSIRVGPSKQREAIARDVLKQITRGQITPTRGVYFRLPEPDFTMGLWGSASHHLSQETIRSKEFPRCQTCALGALFMSRVARFNAVKMDIRSNVTRAMMSISLEKFFPEAVQFDIEHLFESYSSEGFTNTLDAMFRLRFIVKWITRNKGAYHSRRIRESIARLKRNFKNRKK